MISLGVKCKLGKLPSALVQYLSRSLLPVIFEDFLSGNTTLILGLENSTLSEYIERTVFRSWPFHAFTHFSMCPFANVSVRSILSFWIKFSLFKHSLLLSITIFI